MIRVFLFLLVSSLYLHAQISYNIFITSFLEEKKENALKYKTILEEYLELNNINKKVSVSKIENLYTVKIVNFNTLEDAKKVHNTIKPDFKDSFIQEVKLQNIDTIHQKAMEYLKDEKFQLAYDVLLESYEKNNFNNQTLFLLAKSAKDNDDIENAIRFYEELLKLNPNAHRARLDLATLYYENKEYEKSDQQFLIVKSTDIPSQVEKNIENYKIKKQTDNQKNYSIFASLGYMRDTNVNAGPDIDTITMYDIEFTLSDDAKETSDNATTSKLGGSLYIPFESFLLNNSLYINNVDYNKLDDYDSLSYSISTSPMLYFDEIMYMFPLSYTNVKLGSSESYYLKNISFYPTLKKRLNPLFSYLIKLNLDDKKYESVPTKNGKNYGLTFGFETYNDVSTTVGFNTYVNRYDSKNEIYSYNNIGIDFSYNTLITNKLFFMGKLNYDVSTYDKIEDAFTTKKDIYNLNGNLNLIYDLEYFNSSLTFSYYNQINSSNINLYDYRKSYALISLNLRY